MLNCQEVAQSAAVEKMQKETAAVDINAASDAHVFATSTMQLDGHVDENNDMPVQPLPVAPSSPAVVTGNASMSVCGLSFKCMQLSLLSRRHHIAERSCALDGDEVMGSGENIAADNHVDDDDSGGFRVDSTTAISDGPSKKRRVQKPSGEVTVEVVIYKPTLADSTTPAENATPATPVQCESGLALTSAMTTPAAVSASPSPSPSFAVPRPPADLVQIKNGRVVLHEKKLPLDKDLETLKELCEFQQYHAQITDATLVALPDQFHGLLAKLVHESDATVSLLAKQILGQLCPQGLVAEAAAKGKLECGMYIFLC